MKKVVCIIVLVVVVCIGVVAIWQRDNIGALFTGLRYSQEELEDRLQQNDQAIKDTLQSVTELPVRDLTEEDRQALKDGTVTGEELAEKLVRPTTPEKPSNENEPTSPTKTEEEPPRQETGTADVEPSAPDQQEKVAAIIAEVYVLREEFLIKLDDLMAKAMAEYKALAPEDRSSSKLVGMVGNYMATALDMEKQCDARIDEIIIRLEGALTETGKDLSLAQTVFDTYVNEKSLKKAWYMAELKKRGLI